MEPTRVAPSGSSAVQEARGARSARAAQQDDAAQTPQDAFAQLLMALGQDDAPALPAAQDALGIGEQVLLPAAAAIAPAAGVPLPLAQAAAGAAAALPGLLPGAGARASLVGETAWLDGAAEAATVDGRWRDTAAGPAVGRAALRSPAAGGAGGGAGMQAPGAAAVAGAPGVSDSLAATTGKNVSADGAAATATLAQGARPSAGQDLDTNRLQTLMQPAQSAPQTIVTSSAAVPLAGISPTGASAGAPAGDGAVGAAAAAPAPSEAPAAGAEGAAATGDEALADQLAEQIAEQVSYWVHQKTQNAELTLQPGGRAVQVHVALTGEAAHVTFRSDHADARQALDDSSAQLRELLQQQGLELAGVTVGGSGTQPGAHERQDGPREGARAGARQARVQAAAPADGLRAAVRVPGAGRVDLFV